LHQIIPAIHAAWNIKKTASDTITKIIDWSGHRITPSMSYINANSLASTHVINYALVMCHRLRQFFTSTIETHHLSLLDYLHATNQQMAYKHTIIMAVTIFQTMIKKEEKKIKYLTSYPIHLLSYPLHWLSRYESKAQWFQKS
jgi:hypothetical protein